MTETTQNIAGPAAEPRRLARSREGRWLGGVCAGLGRYFNLSPAIYRIAFVALALAGGTGILLYIAAWLVIPDDGVEESIASEAIKEHRDRPWLLVGVGLIGFATIIALSSARVWPSPGNLWVAAALAGAAIVWWHVSTRDQARATQATPSGIWPPVETPAAGETRTAGDTPVPGEPPLPPAPRRRSLGPVAVGMVIAGLGVVGLVDVATGWGIDWRVVLAAAAVVLGGLIAAGAASGHGVGSVVVLALLVLTAFAVSAAVRVPLFAGLGDRTVHPATIASVNQRYEHGIGDFNVDLSDVTFPRGDTHVRSTIGVGNLVVSVPRDVTVEVDARASVGEVILFGRSDSGTGVHDQATETGTDPSRVVVLDARVGLGQVEVKRG